METIPEHGLDGRVRRTFQLVPGSSYPSWWRSWWLTWRNLAFPVLNPQLAVFTAAIYVLLGWAVIGPIEGFGGFTLADAVREIGRELSRRVGMSLVLVGLVAAVILFTDTHSKAQRIVGGGLHGLAHLGAILVAGWAGARMVEAWWPGAPYGWIGVLAGLAIGGAVAAPVILGLYLLVSLICYVATATRRSRRCGSRTGRASSACTSTRPAFSRSIPSASSACRAGGRPPATPGASTRRSSSRTTGAGRRQPSSSRRSR